MPTQDEIDKATVKRTHMASTTGSQVKSTVIPEIPHHVMPPEVLRRMPGLEQWNLQNHAKLMRWREQTNAALVRSPEPPATP